MRVRMVTQCSDLAPDRSANDQFKLSMTATCTNTCCSKRKRILLNVTPVPVYIGPYILHVCVFAYESR